MDPLSITLAAVGWLMSTLADKALAAVLETWATYNGLGKEFETLKEQLVQLDALLTSYRGLRTNNNSLEELVHNLQQLAYRAENLLDELDYYRMEDEMQHRGTHENVNSSSNKSSVASSSSGFRLASRSILSTLKGMSCCSEPHVLISLPETFSSRINLSRRMKELAEQLQKSKENVRKALKTEAQVIIACNPEISQTKATNLPQTSSFLTEPIVFGRDQECDQLMNLLTNEETAIVGKVPVLAIIGSGGVGKTTLARLVFNDPKIHSYFEVRFWICVSNRFDMDRLTREMLEGACGNRYDNLTNLNDLQNKLKDELVSKRFLLVLDDMWEDKDKSQWDSMVAPLNKCMVKGSTILVTARSQSVAKLIDARDISLHGLVEDAFLSFFSTCIFNDPNYGGNWRLKSIGQEIANKLKGNPLAAKTVSTMLKKKLDERYWMKIRDSEEWKSQNGPNDIMPALRLSYEHMPFHLQRCFSYCAIFPEDYRFTCRELVFLWMARGFLDVRSEDKTMEDIGSSYFDDLFDRGFFQTKQTTYVYKDEVYYTFHDLLHNLARMVSLKECLTISIGTEHTQIPQTIRHLSIFNSTERGEEAIVRALACEGENLSTVFNSDNLPSNTFQCISDLLKETKFLRALRLNLWSWVQPPNFYFQNFVSLRYLRLKLPYSNSCKTLPREICRLYHLEVFDIEVRDFNMVELPYRYVPYVPYFSGKKKNLELPYGYEPYFSSKKIKNKNNMELPNNFSDLVSLRHFIVEGNIELHSKIRGVGKLTSLQELNYFIVQQEKGFEIEQLGSLKEIGGSLQISNLENVKSKEEASKARLAEKEKLDVLYLRWNHGEQENESVLEGLKPTANLKSLTILGYGGVASPSWLEPSLIFLDFLTLEDCKAWELLPPIGEFEFLKRLKLSKLPLKEIGPQCYGTRQSMKFPFLEKLEITDMSDLEKWVWSDHLCFKKLKDLTIKGCNKLVDLPLSGCATSKVLKRFPSLERLIIEDCPLIFQLPPLPYSSLLSYISIERTGVIDSMLYDEEMQKLTLSLDQSSSLKVCEVLGFHELNLSSLRSLEISNISGLESLDLHSFVALEELEITGCQSLTSLTFGVSLKILKIRSCESMSPDFKSWVNLELLHFRNCPGLIADWDSASKEIQRTEPDFSLSLKRFEGDSLALLTLPICNQLTSIEIFELEVSSFTEEHTICLQLLTSIDLVDIRGCKKNLQSFPFVLFPSLKELRIIFPLIESLPTTSRAEIIEECKKLRNIKEVHIFHSPVQIHFWTKLREDDMACAIM